MPSDGDNFRTRVAAGWARVCRLLESGGRDGDIASAALAAFEKSIRQRVWSTPAWGEILRLVQSEVLRLQNTLPGLISGDDFMSASEVGLASIRNSYSGAQTTDILIEAARQSLETIFQQERADRPIHLTPQAVDSTFERNFLQLFFRRCFWDPPSARIRERRGWTASQYEKNGEALWAQIEGQCCEAWRAEPKTSLSHDVDSLRSEAVF